MVRRGTTERAGRGVAPGEVDGAGAADALGAAGALACASGRRLAWMMMLRPSKIENRMTLTASLRFPLMAVFSENGRTFSRKRGTGTRSNSPMATASRISIAEAWSEERSIRES